MEIEANLERIKKPVYILITILLYICYFVIYIGAFYVNPKYVEILSKAIRAFICLFLIVKFHPFRQHILKEFDGQLIFASAILLLTDVGITQYVKTLYQQKIGDIQML